jgi:hypothetical protein
LIEARIEPVIRAKRFGSAHFEELLRKFLAMEDTAGSCQSCGYGEEGD